MRDLVINPRRACNFRGHHINKTERVVDYSDMFTLPKQEVYCLVKEGQSTSIGQFVCCFKSS